MVNSILEDIFYSWTKTTFPKGKHTFKKGRGLPNVITQGLKNTTNHITYRKRMANNVLEPKVAPQSRRKKQN